MREEDSNTDLVMSWPRRMIRRLLPLVLIISAVLVVAMLVNVNRNKRPERIENTDKAVMVDVIQAERRSLNFVVNTQGTVAPSTETILVSEVSGKVSSVSAAFVAGGFFRAGEVLLQIDPSDYQTALKRAEAALASRQARLADEQARSDQALRDWRNLGRTGEPSELVLRKPQLQDARANVSAAEADVQKARRDLQRTRITVPYDGLVTEKGVDIGQFVAPGTPLGVTFSVDTAEVRLPISVNDVAYLELPSVMEASGKSFPQVELTAEEGNSIRRWQARIIRTEGVVDTNSRMIYAVAEITDPYGVLGISEQDELKVGTFVRAGIEGIAVEDMIVLPRYAMQNDTTVLIVNDKNLLEIRPVRIARAEPRVVYIDSGLSGGERVITTNLDAPIPGMKLAIEDTTTQLAGEETP